MKSRRAKKNWIFHRLVGMIAGEMVCCCARRDGAVKKRLAGGVLVVIVTVLTVGGEVPRVPQVENTAVRDKNGKIYFKAIYAPIPVYPFKARLHHEGGRGIFRMILRRDGTVSAVAVERSTGMKELDVAAARALIQWQFWSPPLNMKSVRIPVDFRMQSRITGGTILD